MPDFFATNASKAQASRFTLTERKIQGAALRKHTDVIDFATINGGSVMAAGSTIGIGKLPQGALFHHGMLISTGSIPTVTFAIGDADDPDRLRTAAVAPGAAAPQLFCAAAGAQYQFPKETEIQLLTAAGSTPTSGQLIVSLFYTTNQ